MNRAVPSAQPVEPQKPLEVFHSDRLIDKSDLSPSNLYDRAKKRSRLREIVSSSAWYENVTTDKGVKYPVPGMVQSSVETWFPPGRHERPSKAGRRYLSPIAEDERFDRLPWWEAEALDLPPAWSVKLVAGMIRRHRAKHVKPFRREPTLRSVKLGLMAKWEWTKRTARGPVVVSSVRCSYPLIRNIAPKGKPPIFKPTGGRGKSRDRLRQLWPIGEISLVVYPAPIEPVHVTDHVTS